MGSGPFGCPVCGLTFDEEHWSRACAAWCRTHASCNLTITAHARERQAPSKGQLNTSQLGQTRAPEEKER